MQPMACLYTLFDSIEAAQDVVRAMLSERLIACANIHAPCQSHYTWQGEIVQSHEIPVLFKLSADGADAAVMRLEQLHPYNTPAIILWTADSTSDYVGWLMGQTGA